MASACATQEYYWVHPEKGAQQFEEDNDYCIAQGRGTRALSRMPEHTGGHAGSFSTGWDTASTVRTTEMRKNMHRQCMYDRGWRLEAANTPAAAAR